MIKFTLKVPGITGEVLGIVPFFFSEDDPREARDQVHEAYAHGGGWSPFEGFEMLENGNLKFPGDPETQLLAEAKLRDETLRFYDHSWLAIIQPSGGFEVGRLD